MNRRPPACKAGALPTELQPLPLGLFAPGGVAPRFCPGHVYFDTLPSPKARAPCREKIPARTALSLYAPDLVGLERLELSTSRLSGVRSNHLSYRPETYSLTCQGAWSLIESEQRMGSLLLKGGDPAAGSPTATLLRLHPNHRPYRRRLPP